MRSNLVKILRSVVVKPKIKWPYVVALRFHLAVWTSLLYTVQNNLMSFPVSATQGDVILVHSCTYIPEFPMQTPLCDSHVHVEIITHYYSVYHLHNTTPLGHSIRGWWLVCALTSNWDECMWKESIGAWGSRWLFLCRAKILTLAVHWDYYPWLDA